MILKKISLTDQVASIIIDKINKGIYGIGDQLPNETVLSEEFSVSRTTIRAAIKKIEAMDYIQIIHGKGTFVKERRSLLSFISEHLHNVPYQEIIEVRSTLELKIIQLAAERRTEEDIKEIKHYYEMRQKTIESNNAEEWLEADLNFHKAIAKASKNRILEQLYAGFMENNVKTIFKKLYPDILPLNILNDTHLEIIQCIENKKNKDAEKIILNMGLINRRILQ